MKTEPKIARQPRSRSSTESKKTLDPSAPAPAPANTPPSPTSTPENSTSPPKEPLVQSPVSPLEELRSINHVMGMEGALKEPLQKSPPTPPAIPPMSLPMDPLAPVVELEPNSRLRNHPLLIKALHRKIGQLDAISAAKVSYPFLNMLFDRDLVHLLGFSHIFGENILNYLRVKDEDGEIQLTFYCIQLVEFLRCDLGTADIDTLVATIIRMAAIPCITDALFRKE